MIIPALDVINANEAGYELRTVDEFRDILTEAIDSIASGLQDAPPETLQRLRFTEDRFNTLHRMMPHSKCILWKREDHFITLAPSVDSLRKEFPFLSLQKVAK